MISGYTILREVDNILFTQLLLQLVRLQTPLQIWCLAYLLTVGKCRKKLFMYNIKCMWMFTDLTIITISMWSLIAHMKLSQLNFHILH